MMGSFKEKKLGCKNIYFDIFIAKDMKKVFLKMQIAKTNASDPKKKENYWMITLRTLASDGL